MPNRPTLRIFLSSPADVAAERDAAEQVIRSLAQELAELVDLRLVRWENLESRADKGSFQDGIDSVAKVEELILIDDMRLLSHARSRDLQIDELLNTHQIQPLLRGNQTRDRRPR